MTRQEWGLFRDAAMETPYSGTAFAERPDAWVTKLMPRPALTPGLSGEEIAARLDTVLLEVRDPQELQALPGACLGTPAIVELDGRLYLYHGGFSGEILDAEFPEGDEP